MTTTDESGSKLKGEKGEEKVSSELMRDYSDWMLINDVRLPSGTRSAQIDHILVSPYAVFLIETKNMKGKVYGGPHVEKWTQWYGPEKTYTYYNPLWQNEGHAKALVELEIVDYRRLRPIVVFVGGCKMGKSAVKNFESFQKHEKTANGDRESRMRGVVCMGLKKMHDYIDLIRTSSGSELTRQEMEGIRDKIKEKEMPPTPTNGI